jgi:hypothetical protein
VSRMRRQGSVDKHASALKRGNLRLQARDLSV